jgi:hypothetical protein
MIWVYVLPQKTHSLKYVHLSKSDMEFQSFLSALQSRTFVSEAKPEFFGNNLNKRHYANLSVQSILN